jgi:hypothetical protein
MMCLLIQNIIDYVLLLRIGMGEHSISDLPFKGLMHLRPVINPFVCGNLEVSYQVGYGLFGLLDEKNV